MPVDADRDPVSVIFETTLRSVLEDSTLTAPRSLRAIKHITCADHPPRTNSELSVVTLSADILDNTRSVSVQRNCILTKESRQTMHDARIIEHDNYQEPCIVYADSDSTPTPTDDDCCLLDQCSEARLVRMVSVGRSTLVQLLKRERLSTRRSRSYIERPITPIKVLARPASHETLASTISAECKTLSTVGTSPHTPGLSHDEDCVSPTSESSGDMPSTPSTHSFEKERYSQEVESSSLTDTPIPAQTMFPGDSINLASRMKFSRMKLVTRRNTAGSMTDLTASAPSSPLSSPSRLSLVTNLASLRPKLAARGASDRDSLQSLTTSTPLDDLTPTKTTRWTWRDTDTTSTPTAGKRQRLRRMNSRLGLNERKSAI